MLVLFFLGQNFQTHDMRRNAPEPYQKRYGTPFLCHWQTLIHDCQWEWRLTAPWYMKRRPSLDIEKHAPV
jgi:hypothetical protein